LSEEDARKYIDKLLTLADWAVQDMKDLNLGASLGVAIREFPTSKGPADYILFVNRVAVGVIEAKSVGTTLSGVAEQSEKYILGFPKNIEHIDPLPFAYESTGKETYFRDNRDPEPRSRSVFAFHKPDTFQKWLEEGPPLRARLKDLPDKYPLITEGLRECQKEAIQNLEKSFADARQRALIQMATGTGKTYTAVSFCYRLTKHAKSNRILFLVDRNNLGRQTKKEFMQYRTPDDGRKFTELYNVQHLTSNKIDPVNKVCISTIQRVYAMLKGQELDPELEEDSGFEYYPDGEELPVTYNPDIPIEQFDFIITDECHRSIYNLWRQVLEYFDAFIIGLTATPSKQTFGFFNKNLVMEYNSERAIADGVNVDYDVYRIRTKITSDGSRIEPGYYVDKRNKLTREKRWELLDEEMEYSASQLDRNVVSEDQIRTVIRTFKERLFTEIFPDRTEVPKTVIFAKDDSHAEDIVHIVREEFGKGNEFCKKITYRTTGEKTEDLIASFRNSYNPRIVVTVDMISTGTDIRPLECLIFMRDVKSRVYFEQMKGRGTRIIDPDDLQKVSKDAKNKTRFVIVDAVGVCETDKTESRPLERKRSVSFETLIKSIALGQKDEDTILSMASRLSRLDKEISNKDRNEIEELSQKPLKSIINNLLDSYDPDVQIEKAKKIFVTDEPTEKEIELAKMELLQKATLVFDNADFRNKVIEIKKKNEQVIDTVSIDTLIQVGYVKDRSDAAKRIITSLKEFMEKNKDEISALQLIYNKPYGERHFTYKQIKELADAIKKPPYHLTTETIWEAYESLERSKVRGGNPKRLLTNIISIMNFTLGGEKVLEPFSEIVEHRFEDWLLQQKELGKEYTDEQMMWLKMIKDHLYTSLTISIEDFENPPFYSRGGILKAYNVFGKDFDKVLKELEEVLVRA
jgi:type I restriction enzyme R subunit